MPSSPFEIAISECLLSIRGTRLRAPCHAQESVAHGVKGGARRGSSVSGSGANRAPLLPPAAWAEPGPGWWCCSILCGSHASPNVWGSPAQRSAVSSFPLLKPWLTLYLTIPGKFENSCVLTWDFQAENQAQKNIPKYTKILTKWNLSWSHYCTSSVTRNLRTWRTFHFINKIPSS